MKTSIAISASLLALVGPSEASSQTFASTPGTYTFSGMGVVIQKGTSPLRACQMSFDITNDGQSITASNPILTGNGGLCDIFFLRNEPYNVTISGNTVSFNDIYIETYFPEGDCAGTLNTTFSEGSQEELEISTVLPEITFGTGDCAIYGILSWP